MKKVVFLFFIFFSFSLMAQEKLINEKLSDFVKTLVQKYPDKSTTKIGVYEVFMEDGSSNNFTKFLGDEINERLSNHKLFEVIDRDIIIQELKKANFDKSKINNQQFLENIAEKIYHKTNSIPEVFLFTTVSDLEDIIKISVQIVSVQTGSNKLKFTYNLESDEQTDKLLGKKVRIRKVKTDTVTVVKEKVVRDTVTIVKEVIKEQVIEKTNDNIKPNKDKKEFKVGDLVFSLGGAYVIPATNDICIPYEIKNDGDEIYTQIGEGKIITDEGNEYQFNYYSLGSKERFYYGINKTIASGVKLKGEFLINNISIKDKLIKVFEIKINEKKYQLRDIMIER